MDRYLLVYSIHLYNNIGKPLLNNYKVHELLHSKCPLTYIGAVGVNEGCHSRGVTVETTRQQQQKSK